jgi:putative tricarboxylic transport membrane protein
MNKGVPAKQLQKGCVNLKKAGVWSGIFILLFGCFFFWLSLSLKYTSSLGPGPGLFPLWLSAILIVLSLLYIVESIKLEGISIIDMLPKGRGMGNIVSIVASLVVFVIIVSFTGFIIAGTVLLFILFVREYKWYWGLALSFTITAITFVVFQILLEVPLPVNDLGF